MKNTPLTLEQLREMYGKPVYLITKYKGKFWGIVNKNSVYSGERVYFFDDDGFYYEDTWTAYACEPIHIDREVWKPCEFCGYVEYPDKNYYPKSGYVFYAGFYKQYDVDDFHEEETDNVKFCPNCGRPLTEEAWNELEKRLNGGE